MTSEGGGLCKAGRDFQWGIHLTFAYSSSIFFLASRRDHLTNGDDIFLSSLHMKRSMVNDTRAPRKKSPFSEAAQLFGKKKIGLLFIFNFFKYGA